MNPVNDAPAAAAESYSTNEDTPLTVAAPGVLGNDTDTEGSALTAALAAGPAHGTLTLNANGSFTYTPAADWSGTDTFTYRANDGTSSGNTATVTLTVSAVNDAPVANNDSYGTGEETALTVAAPGVLGNDTDAEGDALTAALVAGPAHGTLTLSTNGSFTYAPAADWNGTDTFTYKANDTKADSGVATVSIRVGPANDAPAAGNDSFGTNEDVALTVAAPGVLANDNDTDHDPLTARLIAGPAHGTLALNADGSFTYTPAGDWSGTDTFTYQANDGTADSAVATAGITVSPVNDRPVATEDSYGAAEDTTLTVAAAGVLENDTDIEGDPLTAALVAGPAHGTLALNPDGSFTYRPAANWNGTDTFTYRATDGRVDSATATVRIVVSAANDAPVAANDSYVADEDSTLMVAAPGVLANDTDLDGNVLTAVLVNGPAHGTLTLNPKGYFIYTPAANWNGTDTFTYKASDVSADSTATVSITVRPAGDAPAAANDSYATDEDTALAVAAPGVLANDTDADGDALTAARVAGPAHGALTLNSNGSFAYTPAANWFGTDSFTYRASDGKGNSSTATVTLIVRSINDPPVTANDAYTTHEDTALIVAAPGVLANDTDVDSGTRTAVLVAGPAHGTLALYGSGSFVYRPAANWHGTDTFSYKAREGAANGNVAVVTITVTAANDRPAAAGDSYTTDEDAALMVAAPGVLANDTDADGDALTAARATGPAHGTLALSANGSFTYTPAANWYGTDSFTYQANDGSTSSLPARVNITIRPVVDLSYVTASPLSVTGGAAVVGRVGLGGPAPAGGFTVSLSSSHASVTVPASVTLPAGQSTATFAVTTAAVAADTPVTLTAAGGGTTRTGRLTVKALVVNYLTVSPTAVVGGGRATGRVTLNRPVPAGEVTVALSSGDAAVVVPASVSVVAGTATAVFPITTGPVPANTPVVIAATCGGVGRTATITVKPPTPQMLVVSPATITGGYQCLGSRVLLNAAAPAGGFAVALESGNPAVASVPATVVVPAGQTRGNFTITTTTVSATTAVTIRAAAGGVSRTGVLTVKPRVVR